MKYAPHHVRLQHMAPHCATPLRLTVAITALLTLGACAYTPPSEQQIAVTNAALMQAENTGANEYAPVQMKAARDKMDRAAAATTARDYPLANSLAEEALADVRLAQAKVQSGKALKAADQLQKDRAVLNNEIQRNSNK
jgi:hypothetical protein